MAAVVAVSILVLCALCCYRINKTTDDKVRMSYMVYTIRVNVIKK